MTAVRRAACCLVLVFMALSAMSTREFIPPCRTHLGSSAIDCTPFTTAAIPFDSSGGYSVFVADLAHQPSLSDPGFSVLSKGGPVVGVTISNATNVIPAITLATHTVVSGVHAIALLANAPDSGGIADDAADVSVQQIGDSAATHLIAHLPPGSMDSLHVQLRAGSTVVRSMKTHTAGSVATFAGWPSGFSLRGVPEGIEYTWRLGGMRGVHLAGMTTGNGDRVCVTVPGASGAISPVLLRGVGFDQLTLSLPGGPAAHAKKGHKPPPKAKRAAPAKS